jgi:hypothetical protein
MARRKKQRKTETRGAYLKRVRPEWDEHLKGHVITSWAKGARRVEVAPQPPYNRRDRREMIVGSSPRFQAGNRRHRTEGAHDLGPNTDMPHESPFTKPTLGRRRRQRRATNANARRARRATRA